jgi:hypothetical protein
MLSLLGSMNDTSVIYNIYYLIKYLIPQILYFYFKLDGWAITMLSKENVAWQSICINVGHIASIFIVHTFFVILESTMFSNKYIRPIFGLSEQPHGIISVESEFGFPFILTVSNPNALL